MLSSRHTLSISLLVILAAVSFVRLDVYENEVTLWQDTIEKSPGNYRPHNNFGVALKKANRLHEAEDHLAQALALQPDSAEVLTNLASVYYKLGRRSEAIGLLRRALALDASYPPAQCDLATYLFDSGMMSDAEQLYLGVIARGPDSKEARFARKMLVYISMRRR